MRRLVQEIIEVGPQSAAGRLLFILLWPLSLGYRLAVVVRAFAYRRGFLARYRAAVPVISVGNLTIGGSGKTPMVDLLARFFLERGRRVAIVSRGYGGRYESALARVNAADGALLLRAEECGDEPYLLARRNPDVMVFVARRRRLGVVAAEQDGADLILLDDGFQHLAVQRDADIVLLDSERPFGSGHLLPAGPLREPRGALGRAAFLVRTRADGGPAKDFPTVQEAYACRHSLSGELETLSGDTFSWETLRTLRCAAFAGIARPEAFFDELRRRDLALVATVALDDHQGYDASLLFRLWQECREAEVLLTTEKDAVKLKAADFPVPCCYPRLELDFENRKGLEKALDRLLEEDR